MRRLFLLFVAVLATKLSASADEPALFPDVIPAKLKISYAHEMGSVCEIELTNGKIRYRLNHLGKGEETGLVAPAPERWSAFVSALNAAKVYKWDGHYEGKPMAHDGGFYWSVKLQLGEMLFVSDGDSAFPLDGDIDPTERKSPHAAFDLLISAVSHLIGRNFL